MADGIFSTKPEIERITARAMTPDQLAPYVHAVAGLETDINGSCVFHRAGGQIVFVGYPADDPLDVASMNSSLDGVLELPGLEHIAVISATRPLAAPADAVEKRDQYWGLGIPMEKPSGKLANMLKRASREVEVAMSSGAGSWSGEHEALVKEFCQRKNGSLDEASIFLFSKIGSYLEHVPDAAIFSARPRDGKLAACAIADFTSLGTAFYMFAFRHRDAPPGTADLLLHAIIQEAGKRGHSMLNLGLGINGGVEFFKKKWGAGTYLPCVETSWKIRRPSRGFFARLFGG